MANKEKSGSPENKRTLTIILSIVIAIVLWTYVIKEVNPTTQETIANVPVQLLNVQSLTARDLAISGDAEYTVDVVVKGKRADIINISAEEIIAEADLFGWSKGENFVPVNVIVPEALDIVEIKSPKIQVTIEDLVALSRPVVVVYRGDMPPNTEEGSVEIKPAEIEVTGAKSEVETVTGVQVVIDIADLTAEGETVQGVAVPVNYAGVAVENIKLSANYVSVFAKLLTLKEVPLIMEVTGTLDDGLGAEVDIPKSIMIKGSKGIINKIDSVTAEPLDISGMTEGGTVPLKIVLPEGIEFAKGYEALKARISIEKTATRVFGFTAEQILLEGLTKGKSVNTDATNFEVTVTGRKDIVEALTADQIELYIDVSEAAAGNQNVRVMVSYDIPLHMVTVNPEQITITVIETELEGTHE